MPVHRDLFVDCVAASGSPSAAAFILDLIEERELKGFQALWLLMSSGHSVRQPKVPLLRKFVVKLRHSNCEEHDHLDLTDSRHFL